MRLLLIAGSHPRHGYIANSLFGENLGDIYDLDLLIADRGTLLPSVNEDLTTDLRHLWQRHFNRRLEVEAEKFGVSSVDKILCSRARKIMFAEPQILDFAIREAVEAERYDFAFVLGSQMISSETLNLLPTETLNLHLGLSPRYRGSATLFWPSYNLEPEFSGLTLHRLAAEPDAGQIVHQTALTNFDESFDVHESAAETILQGALEISQIVDRWLHGAALHERPQPNVGKTYLTTDFKAHHLATLYDYFDGKVISWLVSQGHQWRRPRLFRENL